MEPSQVLEALLDVAREAGLEVRPVRSSALEPGEAQPASAVCRVKGRVWVMLSSVDPVAIQLDVLAGALREHARDVIERRHFAPAVRRFLDPS